jgi:hypothetical protein
MVQKAFNPVAAYRPVVAYHPVIKEAEPQTNRPLLLSRPSNRCNRV